jgi:hypothetical protein
MSPSSPSSPNDGSPQPHRRTARRCIVAGAAATTLAVTALSIVSAGAQGAGAATRTDAQAVGNFVDATLGGNTLDAVAKLKYATAKAPGSASAQNPLDVTALTAINLPMTGALQLPTLAGIHLGAVTQKAQANVNGASYGQAGAVLDSGGASVGGDDSGGQAGSATIDLTAAGLAGSSPVPLPGGGSAAALGGATLTADGVSAVASTPKGAGTRAATAYRIADLRLHLDSPALGQLLGTALSSISGALAQGATSLGGVSGGLTGCDLTSGTVPSTISLDKGAVVVDPANAGLTIDVNKLLAELGLNLNSLPANTDLMSYVLAYLADPKGLAAGLTAAVNDVVDPLQAQFAACTKALPDPLGTALQQLADALSSGQQTIESSVSDLVAQLSGAAGSNPLAPLASALHKLVDIGVNVQPNGAAGPAGAAYADHLAATPKQGTAVVRGQTIVRALEVNVAATGSGVPGLGAIPGLSALPDASPLRAAAPDVAQADPVKASNTGLLTLALANAAAGPSRLAAATSSAPAPSSHGVSPASASAAGPNAVLPTGIDAGSGTRGGTPVTPIVLLISGLALAGAGAVAWRFRGVGGGHLG